MDLTLKQQDATVSALHACHRLGLYSDLSFQAFRARLCSEVVSACQGKCPLDPANFGTCLLTFLTRLIGNLESLGYSPQINLQLLCAVKQTSGGLTDWTWGDWCDHLARRL